MSTDHIVFSPCSIIDEIINNSEILVVPCLFFKVIGTREKH